MDDIDLNRAPHTLIEEYYKEAREIAVEAESR